MGKREENPVFLLHFSVHVLFFYFTPGLRKPEHTTTCIVGTNNEFESLEFACITVPAAGVKRKAFTYVTEKSYNNIMYKYHRLYMALPIYLDS